MATKRTNSSFEVTEDFLKGTEGTQDKAVRAFIAANPKAAIVPNQPGQVAPFLRRQVGKRFNISQQINGGGSAREILAFARKYGGGERDIAAHLTGGFSRTSKFYGTPIIELLAAA
jgi:hypothetical protein